MTRERLVAVLLLGVLVFSSSVDASGCGGVEVTAGGTLLCPPRSSTTTTCSWTIMAPSNSRVCLKFTTFEVQTTPNPEEKGVACSSPMFSVYKGYLGPSALLLYRLCSFSLSADEICIAAKVVSVCYNSNQSDDSNSNPCAVTYRIARM